MNYWNFKNKLFELGCFTPDQIYAWMRDFNRVGITALRRWGTPDRIVAGK